MLYEIHMLKNYPPVNLNRDDAGSPKTCFFGGSQRGRISSQCLKHTWRTSELYGTLLPENSIRTKKLYFLIEEELKKSIDDSDFIVAALKKISDFAKGDKKGETKSEKKETDEEKFLTKQVIAYSEDDVKRIAEALIKCFEACGKSVKEFSKKSMTDIESDFVKKNKSASEITFDIALFGRMVTSKVLRNVEAAVQVAHAVSIHTVNQESDYFTAADDLLREGETGAGMIGDIDYNSCCYYFYVAIDTDILAENLKDSPDAAGYIKDILPAFIKLMAFTDPTGKQNSFAGHVLPSLICVEKKETKIPVSLVNAFAKPVNARKGDVVKDGADALKKEIDTNDKCFGIPSERFWFTKDGFEAPEKGTVCASVQELCEKCAE